MENTSGGRVAPTTSEAGGFLLRANATQPAENVRPALGTEPSYPRSDEHGSGSAPEKSITPVAPRTGEPMAEPHAEDRTTSRDPSSNSTPPPPSNDFQHVDLYVGANGEITLQKPDGSLEHSQAGNDDKPMGHNERLVTRQLLDASMATVMLDAIRTETSGYKFAQILKDWKPEPLPETSRNFGPPVNRELSARDIWVAREKQVKDTSMYVLGNIGLYWNQYNSYMSLGAMAIGALARIGNALQKSGFAAFLESGGLKGGLKMAIGLEVETFGVQLMSWFEAYVPAGVSILEQGMGPWGLAAIGVQLMVMSYQLSAIQDKVNKIYDEVKELRSSLEAFRTEMKQYTVTVMEGANRQQSMTEKRGKVDTIMQMSDVYSQQGLVDEKELAELLVYIANELLGQNGVGSLPYMDSLWNYIKTTHSIDDSDDKADFSGAAHLEVARAILNVSATYMDLYMTLRTGMEHLMFKATWYGSAEAVAKYGKNTASDKQKICAEYISQLLVPKMQRIVQLHDPLGREDIKHYAQFAFGGALVAKIGLLTALKTARPLFPRLERLYQTCDWGAGLKNMWCSSTSWFGFCKAEDNPPCSIDCRGKPSDGTSAPGCGWSQGWIAWAARTKRYIDEPVSIAEQKEEQTFLQEEIEKAAKALIDDGFLPENLVRSEYGVLKLAQDASAAAVVNRARDGHGYQYSEWHGPKGLWRGAQAYFCSDNDQDAVRWVASNSNPDVLGLGRQPCTRKSSDSYYRQLVNYIWGNTVKISDLNTEPLDQSEAEKYQKEVEDRQKEALAKAVAKHRPEEKPANDHQVLPKTEPKPKQENDSPSSRHVDPTKPFEAPDRAFQMLCDKELRWGRWDADRESRLVDVKKDKDALNMTRVGAIPSFFKAAAAYYADGYSGYGNREANVKKMREEVVTLAGTFSWLPLEKNYNVVVVDKGAAKGDATQHEAEL